MGHGRPFINSIFYLDSALKTAVKGRFMVDPRIGPDAIYSMTEDNWRPSKGELRKWGFPEDVIFLLTRDCHLNKNHFHMNHLELVTWNSFFRQQRVIIFLINSNRSGDNS